MRLPRIKIQGQKAVYHCICRVVGGQCLLETLDREKLRRLLWRQARFCGIQVVTHGLLSNHFHLALRVPAPQTLSDTTLFQRARRFYGAQHPQVQRLKEQLQRGGQLSAGLRASLVARMGDLSVFMKELKQGFSRWYNRVHERFGTLWAERFKSLVVEDQPAVVQRVAAYVDLNAARAGLVPDPKDYRFCGYGEAVGGNEEARAGIASFHEPGLDWAAVGAAYREVLFGRGAAAGASGKRELEPEAVRAVWARGGQLSVAEQLRLRIRYFSDGVALGSREFVNEVFARYRQRFGAKRKEGARRLRGLGWRDMRVLRDLRVRVIG